MSTKLHRTFSTRERFVTEFVRRLSERGIELNLPGEQAPPIGTVLHLDLRLDDGAELVVGTGEVTEGGRPGDAFRVRFLELSKQTRAHLGELVIKAESVPTGYRRPASAGSQSLVDLVAETYGSDTPPGLTDASAVMVPPDSVGTAPSPAAPAPAAPVRPEPERKPKRSLRRLQISPSVIAIAVIAGAAGAAAQTWFDDLAELVWHLKDDTEYTNPSAPADLRPTGVAPSDFSSEGVEGNPLSQAGSQTRPDGEGTDGETLQADTDPTLEGSAPGAAMTFDEGVAATLGLVPASQVRLITWEERVGSTVITLWGNGPFLTNRVSYFPIPGGQPRMLIKLRGIDLPYRETVLTLSTPEVERVRTGFHPQNRVNELHLVLDLAAADVGIERMEHGESSLSFYLGPNTDDGTEPGTQDVPAG